MIEKMWVFVKQFFRGMKRNRVARLSTLLTLTYGALPSVELKTLQ
jgi:hypothetical protein